MPPCQRGRRGVRARSACGPGGRRGEWDLKGGGRSLLAPCCLRPSRLGCGGAPRSVAHTMRFVAESSLKALSVRCVQRAVSTICLGWNGFAVKQASGAGKLIPKSLRYGDKRRSVMLIDGFQNDCVLGPSISRLQVDAIDLHWTWIYAETIGDCHGYQGYRLRPDE